MLDERSVQRFQRNIFKNKGNVESMLNESLNQFKHFFTLSTMLNDLFKRPRHLVQQSVKRMLKQMLKPFKRAFSVKLVPPFDEVSSSQPLFEIHIFTSRSFSFVCSYAYVRLITLEFSVDMHVSASAKQQNLFKL